MLTDSTTEELKHTPGPWKWMDYPDGRKLLLSKDRAVIHCPDAPMTCDPADARLIAAAPDLLAAARKSLDYLASYPGDGALRAWSEVRDAIARAEGRTA